MRERERVSEREREREREERERERERERDVDPIQRIPENKTTRKSVHMSWKERNRTAANYKRPCGLEGCDHQQPTTDRANSGRRKRISHFVSYNICKSRTVVFSICDSHIEFFNIEYYSNSIRSSFIYTLKIK